jgi:NAD(P)-dependent dehydrogenase (short-subunit alcohol dehydrogenase family)
MGYLADQADLEGKVAVIMGGAEGLGRGIALALARCGVDLALCDRKEEPLEATVEDARGTGAKVLASVFDVRDDEAQLRFFAEVDEAFGRLDILVNVAGGVKEGDFLDSDPETWERDYAWNFRYVLRSTQEAARRMRDQGSGGSIVNLTSIEGHRSAPGFSVYSGLKGALTQFTRTIAVELAPLGIRANSIAPDQTPTPNLGISIDPDYFPPIDDHEPDEVFGLMLENAIPLGRAGAIDDIANAAVFLASDLSAYLTGQTLHVDGGAFASSGWFNWPGLGFRCRVPTDVAEAMLDLPEPKAGDGDGDALGFLGG